jgi:hypothetical protein
MSDIVDAHQEIGRDQIQDFVGLVERYTLEDSRTYGSSEGGRFDDRWALYKKDNLSIGVRSLVAREPEPRDKDGIPIGVYRYEQYLVSVGYPPELVGETRISRARQFIVSNLTDLELNPRYLERTTFLPIVPQGRRDPEEIERQRQHQREAACFARSIGENIFTQARYQEVQAFLRSLTPADQVPVHAP